MAGIADAQVANERRLVKSLSGGLLRENLPAPWSFPDLPSAEPSRPKTLPAKGPKTNASRLRGIIHALTEASNLEVARGLFFLLLPVMAGFGAVIYFTLPFEPDWLPLLSILALLAVMRVLARRKYLVAQWLTLALALQLGLIAGKWETCFMATPMLGSDVATRIVGRVTALEYRENGTWRITLDLIATERPKLRYAPQRIRITARDIPAATTIGSGLTGFARLRVPSGPVRPGNYDFSFHAYFQGLGANGFFLGTPKMASVPPQSDLSAQMSAWIALLRIRVSERVLEVIGGEDGSVAAALIAGTRGSISEETNEDLRKAGLAHILSISGLHMALAAAVVMLSLRLGFALFPAFSVRHPVKKYAAFLSLLSCTFYLAMSGADVAAQRSYVMIAVMLMALLADRAAISMRNLAIAAIAMIAISPHEVLGPSFQMSFSATAALIAAYAWWSERKVLRGQGFENHARRSGWATKIFGPAFATAGTSLVAGLASGLFAAYHFNNTAPLGLLGNVLALPAISLLVMPFAVFGLLLMPLGLDWLPLQIVGFGIWVVRQVAALVALWSPDGNPGAMPISALILWTIALVLAVVLTTRLRFLALPFVALGLMAFVAKPFPDVVISEDAKLVGVRHSDGRFALNRARPAKFTFENWKVAYLATDFISPNMIGSKRKALSDGAFNCEDGLCTIELRDGRMLAYTSDPAMAETACIVGDVVILAIAGETLTCPDRQKLVISKRDLALKGSAEIRLGAENLSAGHDAIAHNHPANRPGLGDKNAAQNEADITIDAPSSAAGFATGAAASVSVETPANATDGSPPVSRIVAATPSASATDILPINISSGNSAAIPIGFDTTYADSVTYAVGVPQRPWHLNRLYSLPARGLPERDYKKRASPSRNAHSSATED